MTLHSQFTVVDHVLIVTLSGEIDHHAAKKLRIDWQFVYQDSSCRHVIVNMKEVTFMDSSGIGVLLGRFKEIEQAHGLLVVCCLHENVRQIFHMSGLHKIFHIVQTEEEAYLFLEVDPSCKMR